ncbi:formylglycine-generating enzyme family protein [Amycolatopsis sp. NPDC059021]|uniref:formylglycine-generating enzyme family protein n=1 Tax=Amycolatopsis sp. NPDC059021 TaxID=3346704 RepID=UPI0036722101
MSAGVLWWSRTPITCAQLGYPGGALPVTGLTFAAAERVARNVGGRLPTAEEWEAVASGSGRRFPWGEAEWTPRRANLRGSGHGHPLPAGSFPDGDTPDGLADLAGNVWEWTCTRLADGGVVVVGGSYNSLPRYARCGYRNAVPPELVSPGIGLRVVRDR